jgi:DNA-binding CsgD family transcriptional regulator
MAVDESLRIVGWSETMADITGVAGSAALGRPCWELVAGCDERGEPVCAPDCRLAHDVFSAGAAARMRIVVPRGSRRAELEMSTSKVLMERGPALVHIFHRRGLSVSDAEPRAASLTSRQQEVLALLAEGLGTAAIAARLGLSKETVRNHVRAVLRALGVHSRLEAVVEARQRGLL